MLVARGDQATLGQCLLLLVVSPQGSRLAGSLEERERIYELDESGSKGCIVAMLVCRCRAN